MRQVVYFGRIDSQIGLEPTPDAYVAAMVEVFREVRRVLRDDGVLWLNLGDSYASGEVGRVDAPTKAPGLHITQKPRSERRIKQVTGVKSKDLVGIPWMVAFALRADGWYLRSDIIWAKPNQMPESVTDRPTKAHEYIFLLSKQAKYFYDADAIAEPALEFARTPDRPRVDPSTRKGVDAGVYVDGVSQCGVAATRNARSVWTIPTQPYPDAHFATFPEAIPERCIKAGSKLGDTVLDPFCGSGTTGKVAIRLGRSFIGIELSQEYAKLARTRIGGAAPLFAAELTEARV